MRPPVAGSSNGRTPDSGSGSQGSSPCPAARNSGLAVSILKGCSELLAKLGPDLFEIGRNLEIPLRPRARSSAIIASLCATSLMRRFCSDSASPEIAIVGRRYPGGLQTCSPRPRCFVTGEWRLVGQASWAEASWAEASWNEASWAKAIARGIAAPSRKASERAPAKVGALSVTGARRGGERCRRVDAAPRRRSLCLPAPRSPTRAS